jgi:protein-S-isoprenylcysteine O-methyltransferase Ste14
VLESWLAALSTIAVALGAHSRAAGDETKLIQRLGQSYAKYLASVTRWGSGLFQKDAVLIFPA